MKLAIWVGPNCEMNLSFNCATLNKRVMELLSSP